LENTKWKTQTSVFVVSCGQIVKAIYHYHCRMYYYNIIVGNFSMENIGCKSKKIMQMHTMRINDHFQKGRVNGIFVLVDLNLNVPSSAGLLLITWY